MEIMDQTEKTRNELKQARERYDRKLHYFNTLHSMAKFTKLEMAELRVQMDVLEKKINGLNEKGK